MNSIIIGKSFILCWMKRRYLSYLCLSSRSFWSRRFRRIFSNRDGANLTIDGCSSNRSSTLSGLVLNVWTLSSCPNDSDSPSTPACRWRTFSVNVSSWRFSARYAALPRCASSASVTMDVVFRVISSWTTVSCRSMPRRLSSSSRSCRTSRERFNCRLKLHRLRVWEMLMSRKTTMPSFCRCSAVL